MTPEPNHYSVDRQRLSQLCLHAVICAGMLLFAAMSGYLLSKGTSSKIPAAVIALCVACIYVGIIWRRPLTILYFLVAAALIIEQWPIAGLSVFTTQPFFQTLSGAGFLPLPVSPAEITLLLTLAAVLLQSITKQRVYKGALFGAMMWFLVAVLLTMFNGWAVEPGTFNINVAWAEARSFVYLVITYVLAANLITDRKRLITLVWVIVLSLGFKGFQGMYHWHLERRSGLHLEALTGHEDVVFFAMFFLLAAAMKVYAHHRRQQMALFCLAFPVLFTDLATGRRLGFIVLAIGFILFGLGLLWTRRQLFFRIVPVVLVITALYSAAFWNRDGGMLGQPIRAFKSQFSETTERDRLSDVWRDLENLNIAYNIESAPITGLGFGQPYKFYIELPSLESTGFVYWIYITHNAIFWLWMKMGIIGFTSFWYVVGSSVVQGLITFRTLQQGYLKAIALVTVGLVAMQIFFSYGDLGLTYARSMILMGSMLGVLVRLPLMDKESLDALPELLPEQRVIRRTGQHPYRESLSTT